ncbi:conserved protein, unknown function [Hepatocystis sp. ex Piliocolobus tephrosceles]|nr:conserved protein, unknown function [Hepatocystis sp. ex Piliocolobus tephrosceles]
MNQLNNKSKKFLEYKPCRGAAGKPTCSNPNYNKLHRETKEKEFKSCTKKVDYRNRTSIFNNNTSDTNLIAGNINSKSSPPSAQKCSKRKLILKTSVDMKSLIENEKTNLSTKKYGKKHIPDIRNLYIFTDDTKDQRDKNSPKKKISSYIKQKNPCRWGVDVLQYQLTPPKKIYKHVDNLLTCLVPKVSKDTYIPKKNKCNYNTNLETSLYPKKNILNPVSGRRNTYIHESQLQINCVPKNYVESKTKVNIIKQLGNLNINLIPNVEEQRKTQRINAYTGNTACSISLTHDQNPLPHRSGKRIGYMKLANEIII